MRYNAVVQVYDMMDQVAVSAVVRVTDVWAETKNKTLLLVGTRVQGQGLTDPARWLQAALRALLEQLSKVETSA